jgi:hypothetical protein
MSGEPAAREQALADFVEIADELVTLVGPLSDEELDLSREPGQWSIRQIVHHLADDGDVWSMCIKKAIATPGASVRFEGFPGNEAWADALDFGERDIGFALQLIIAHRQYVASLLRDLDTWDNSFKLVDAEGKVQREITVREMVPMLTDHMATHVATIRAICEVHGVEEWWLDEDEEDVFYDEDWLDEDVEDVILEGGWLDEYGEEAIDQHRSLERRHMLAAEIFGYSYVHYWDHLLTGNARFLTLMPDDVDALARAEVEGWDPARLAPALDVPEKVVDSYQRGYREAVQIVDAPTPAAAFRRGVYYSIQHAIEEGLDQEGAVQRLVTQIGYRAADLAFRLDMEGSRLSDYEEKLKEETEYDRAHWQEQLRRRWEDEGDQPGEEKDD